MIIDMRNIGLASVLAGAVSGQQAFGRLIEALGQEPDQPEPLFIDFRNIEVATASFLRESVVAFRKYVRERKPKFYPVIANAAGHVRDELLDVFKHDAMMSCQLDEKGNAINAAPIGELEGMQRRTFELVRKHGETDAATLMRNSEDNVKPTAWNNRLATLAELGLVIEVSRGRAKRYRPLFNGV